MPFGIGSAIKDAFRKAVPNELAEVAVKAAPFVAPFNPAVAAAMAGLGSFDQTGRIGSSVRSGLGTYALGQGARYLGGANFQGNPFTPGGAFRGGMQGFTGGFSSPFGTETGIGSLFREPSTTLQASDPTAAYQSAVGESSATGGLNQSASDLISSAPDFSLPGSAGGTGLTPVDTTKLSEISLGLEEGVKAGNLGSINTKLTQATKGKGLSEFLNASVGEKSKMALDWFNSLKGSTKLALGIGTASAALQYLENKGQEKERSDFALFRDRPTDFYNLQYKGGQQAKDGGIIGLANGGEPAMEMDYRGGGFIPVGAKERADDVPARLSKNEFVMTADAVRAAGGGSVDVGAQKMYDLMNKLEAQA